MGHLHHHLDILPVLGRSDLDLSRQHAAEDLVCQLLHLYSRNFGKYGATHVCYGVCHASEQRMYVVGYITAQNNSCM
jgi:hypothetical protein